MIDKQANLNDKTKPYFKIFIRTILSTLAVYDSAFCSNLANVSEIGHLYDFL